MTAASSTGALTRRRKRLGSDNLPTYEVVEVTPELAAEWLRQNTKNRNLRRNAVASYVRDMLAGSWIENGEAIKFSKDGRLLDGQHRLHAIVESGVTIRMLIVTNLPSSTQETMDDGRKRTLADALSLRNEVNANILGALIRRSINWERGIYRTRSNSLFQPTNSECMAFLDEHPELRESTRVSSSLRPNVKLPCSVTGLAHWVFTHIDEEDSTWFFNRLSDGANLEVNHPILMLRRRALAENDAQGRIPEDMLLAFVIKTWNAYRRGEELGLLRFKSGGANPEKFPRPV